MRVLLVPPKNNYPNPGSQVDFGIGQGMPYLAGALKASGHEVFGANIYHRWCHGSAPLTLESVLRKAIITHKPQLIGVGGLASDYLFIHDTILFCRQIAPDIPIVCGGGIITYDAEFIFSQLRPDYAIIGEGEISIVSLAEYLEKGGGLPSISNLVYQDNEGRVNFNEVKYPENLDELPYPDYEPFDFQDYFLSYDHMNYSFTYTRLHPKVFPIAIGRSCPFRCTFCCKGSTYRTRSIDSAIKEIAYFYRKYKFNILYITDELFSIKNGKAKEFCDKVKLLKKELDAVFDWTCCLRITDVNKEIFKEMKDAGCTSIFYGFESASDTVLKSMNKGTSADQILRAIEVTEEAGIGIRANMIFGDIAETPATIKETEIFYNKYCRDHCVDCVYITPYPGSKIFNYCCENSIIIDRQNYYETVAHEKNGINMTEMSDDIFYGLTKPLMPTTCHSKIATVFFVQKNKSETCDLDIPFEMRRSFYEIKAICPHCLNQVEYMYPIKVIPGKKIKPIQHFCVKCHKRITLDISLQVDDSDQKDESYQRFYSQTPYSNYYPFNSDNYIMQTAPTPYLLESYKQYNIVQYADIIYGISQSLGELDIAQLDGQQIKEFEKIGMWFTGNSIEGIKKFIDKPMNC